MERKGVFFIMLVKGTLSVFNDGSRLRGNLKCAGRFLINQVYFYKEQSGSDLISGFQWAKQEFNWFRFSTSLPVQNPFLASSCAASSPRLAPSLPFNMHSAFPFSILPALSLPWPGAGSEEVGHAVEPLT